MTDRPGPRGAEVARKTLHLMMATVPVAWAAGAVTDQQVRIGIAVLAITALIVDGARLRSAAVHRAFERVVGSLLRPHEQRSLTGATWLAIGCFVAVFAFPHRAALSALWAVAVGDALAALAGSMVRPPLAAPLAAPREKTIAGSLSCLAVTAFGAWWLAAAAPLTAVLIGTAAAVAERPRTGVNDNVRVAAAAGLAAWAFGVA